MGFSTGQQCQTFQLWISQNSDVLFSHVPGKCPTSQARGTASLWRQIAITLFIQSGTAPRGETETDRCKYTSIAECSGVSTWDREKNGSISLHFYLYTYINICMLVKILLCIHMCIHVFKYIPINTKKLYTHTFYICIHIHYMNMSYMHILRFPLWPYMWD